MPDDSEDTIDSDANEQVQKRRNVVPMPSDNKKTKSAMHMPEISTSQRYIATHLCELIHISSAQINTVSSLSQVSLPGAVEGVVRPVFMGPPENPLLSDEDSDDEDFINPDINHLSGNQLHATAELHARHLQDTGIVSTIMGGEDILEEYPENVNTPDNENKSNRIKTITPCRKWQDMDLPLAPEPTWEPSEWLQNNYSPEGNIKFKVTINEIIVFLEILLLIGYCSVQRYRMYWETSSDTHNEVVSKEMSRNTFEDILKYLHVYDNLTLDENGKFGVGGSAVIDLVDKLPHGQYSIYIDNFFTCVRLLEELKSKGHYYTGTSRSNRIEKASLEEASTLKKKVRSSYSQLTDTDGGITLIRYHDNNIVGCFYSSRG
uniref:PiggyBac transposable element-derived protein domain-containing protein n=1 Tax=Timema douglasi TaxID=61478 RepID=A0A7R8VZS0_TIMDO|nr:unnamed protein product [Timema douglasi]